MMDIKLLNVLLELRDMNQSDLARATGLSRQAISAWLGDISRRHNSEKTENMEGTQSTIDPKLSIAVRLAECFNVSLADLLIPFPLTKEQLDHLTTTLLWDRLYPSLIAFCVALVQLDLCALARLVQVFGFFEAEKILGKRIWREYPRFKHFMIPVRAKQCEQLWKTQYSLNLI